MICSPPMFNRFLFMVCSPPKLIAAKVYTTWFVHRSSSSHDATVARSLHGGSPSFSPFLRFQFYEGLGFGCNNQLHM
jgi:hypothetical protein